ncbi:hypothetical protein FSP39_020729 [Pinctada imbricata]|uniref:Uncharacterized protein n=1 Tax=Pinctada imbricata TaxID=66713 RepID=A0AA88XXR4_PINIB|nr:hypothetical protein FSP39_020729 [Pinctada imbricata]
MIHFYYTYFVIGRGFDQETFSEKEEGAVCSYRIKPRTHFRPEDCWDIHANVLYPRANGGAILLGQNIYQLGGKSYSKDCDVLSVESFNTRKRKSREMFQLPESYSYVNVDCVLLKPRLYRTVVDDVISNVREAFLDEGVDEQVLQELKQLWESKLTQSRALDMATETPDQSNLPTTVFTHQMIPQTQKPQPNSSQQFIGATGVMTQAVPVPVQLAAGQTEMSTSAATAQMALPQGVFQQQLQALAAQGLTLQPAGNGQFIIQALPQQHGGQLNAPQFQQVTMQPTQVQAANNQQKPHGVLQLDGATDDKSTDSCPSTSSQKCRRDRKLKRRKSRKATITLQLDGTNDTSSSEDEFDDDDDDNENDEERNEDENDEQGEEEEPLNSEDDVSDEDPTDLFDTDNVVVCQYDKINRNKNKWKFHLKDGIMNLNGKDYVFQKATGDAEW